MPSSQQFLRDLGNELEGRLPAEVSRDIQLEIACDLHHRIEAYKELDFPTEGADAQACLALGNPKKLARGLVLAHLREFSPRWAKPLMLLTSFVVLFWPWAFWAAMSLPADRMQPVEELTMHVTWGLVSAFALFALLHGRWAWKSLLASVGAGCILNWILLSGLFLDCGKLDGYQILSPWEGSRVMQDLPADIVLLKEKLAGRQLPSGAKLQWPGDVSLESPTQELRSRLSSDINLLADAKQGLGRPRLFQLWGFLPQMVQFFAMAFAAAAAISGLASALRLLWRELSWRRRRYAPH